MARPRLRAQFFVTPDGVAISKAPPLKRGERLTVFARDRAVCRYCGESVSWGKPFGWPFKGDSPAHVDHVLPRARGGQNDPANLALACERCNESKGAA